MRTARARVLLRDVDERAPPARSALLPVPALHSARATVISHAGDLGQSSWMTVKELDEMMGKLGVTKDTKMLEIGSGAGGTSVYIAKKYGCTMHGVDLNPNGACRAARRPWRREPSSMP